MFQYTFFFFQAEDGIRDAQESRGLGDVYKRQAYISDVGMTGGHGGVIGMDKEAIVYRFLTGMPTRFEVCKSDLRMDAVAIEIDEASGRSLSITRLSLEL